jgi:hypothetical protein
MQLLDWDDLIGELNLWAEDGHTAEFWWRDDDAAGAGPALTRLLRLAQTSRTSLALAVVPAMAGDELAHELERCAHVTVVQHGFAHRNHAAPGGRAVECGGERPVDLVLDELCEGYRRLSGLFGSRFAPVLAPPWNRIEAPVMRGLARSGYRGLSAFGPRASRAPAPGLVAVNAHVDPLNWRGKVRFAGRAKVIGNILGELRARRTGGVDAGEPLGLLTHHQDHEPDTWEFIEHLLDVTQRHPAARWISVEQAFVLGIAEPVIAADPS